MHRTYADKAMILSLIILFFINDSSIAIYEPNNSQPFIGTVQSSRLENKNKANLTGALVSHFDIVLGFALGLLSTCFVEHLQKRRKTKEFRQGICAELKQTLATMSILALHPDANITREKLESWISLSKEFDLHREISPLRNDPQFAELTKKTLSEKDLNDIVALFNNTRSQREKEGNVVQSIRKVNCAFIQNNISCISLLREQERSHLYNILRHLDMINMEISRLNFFFEKSYDESLQSENRERLRINYRISCQHISDVSYEAEKEIAHVLRQ